MRMKIIERIKELQPSDWPEPIVKDNDIFTIIGWMFTKDDYMYTVFHASDTDSELIKKSSEEIINEYAENTLKSAISAYNERFPDGH